VIAAVERGTRRVEDLLGPLLARLRDCVPGDRWERAGLMACVLSLRELAHGLAEVARSWGRGQR